MNSIFILDACALIALLAGEPGAEKVRDIVQDAINGEKIVTVAECIIENGTFVTSDHTDFEKVEIV